MRIVAGRWRGRKLIAPPGVETRPSADRTREAVFSMLTSRLGGFDDLLVLDLFAGTGAWALEALSRGAARATLVDRSDPARAAIRANVEALGAQAAVEVLALDAVRLPAGRPHHLAFLDPPWAERLAAPALACAQRQGWLAPGAWVAVETAAGDAPLPPPGLVVEAVRRIGRAEITLLRSA